MITWILDMHVDRVRNSPTPFIEEALKRNHIVHGLRDSIIPKWIDLSGITISGPTIVRGSHGFVGYVERELKPSPGGFLHPEHFKASVYVSFIGDFALNKDFQIVEYKDFVAKSDVFVKPLEEMKKFTGVVVEKGQLLKDKHIAAHGKWFDPDPSCKLVIAPFRSILREYRVVVVDGVPITGSDYTSSSLAPQHVLETVQELCNLWNPADVYVVDIAQTENGNKVVEYNQFSTSAMYACEQDKIVDALETLLSELPTP